MQIERSQTDILILGSGGAGLFAALHAHAADPSLDIDGIDWYVLRSLLRVYAPRVFVCEINNTYPADPPHAVVYDPAMGPQTSDYFGATLGAYRRLAEFRGYLLVHCLPWNAFFVRRELLPEGIVPRVLWAPRPSWPRDPLYRPWQPITAADVEL